MHEVVTVQLGNRANYVATHFWNVQESYFTYPTPTDTTPAPSLVDHDINFRPGIGVDGSDTYTPRTLIYDFQANFGGLRKLNALYESLEPTESIKSLWDGIQQTHRNTPVQPTPYQVNLESGLPTPQLYPRDVRYWSDFNHLYYHPRSIVPLSPQSFSSSLNATETWSNGMELFKDIDREVDILDRDIRPFVEECDSLSAFQIFSSVDDSWGGYAAGYVEALREEYGKKGIWVWAIEDGQRMERMKQYRHLSNSAQSLNAISSNASAYIRLTNVPSSPPAYLQLDTKSEWSMSALLCAAIESATLPTRLRNNGTAQTANPSIFEDMLNTTGNQNIWTLQARARGSRELSSQPSNSQKASSSNQNSSQATDSRIQHSTTATSNNTHTDETEIEPSTFDINFTPTLPTAQSTFPSLSNTRTPISERIFAQVESYRSTPQSTSTTNHHPQHQSSQPTIDTPVISIYTTPLPFPLLTSYPSTLFTQNPNHNHSSNLCIDAALSTTSTTKTDLLTLRDLVAGRTGRAMNLIDSDEVEGVYDELTRMADAYSYGWEGSGDEMDEEDD